MAGTPRGDALPPPPQRATPARKGARFRTGAGSPRPHRPHPRHTGRVTLAARSTGRAAGGGTAPDTRRPSQRWQATPPGTAPHHPRGTQPPQGMQARGTVLGPHTHRPAPTARGWRTPTARPIGGQSGEGQRLTSDAPHTMVEGALPGDTFPPPPQRATPARKGARCGADVGPHARADRTRDTRVAEPRLPAPEDGRPGEGQRLTPDVHDGKHPPRGRPSATPTTSNAPTHQRTSHGTSAPHPLLLGTATQQWRNPRPHAKHAPDLRRRALGLRDGEGDPPQGDAGTDSDLEAVPEPPTGGAPAEPAPPAGSVPTLCPAWKGGHCTGEGRCPKQHPQPGPDDGALPEVKPAAACAALRYGVAQGWILDETARGSVNIQEAVDRVTHAGQAAVALHTRGRHGGPAEGIIVEP